jgi:peptidoglycan/LPS O-acetylase OafA/YrhL
VFSYSLYLTHELVIMQSWWFVSASLPPILNALLIVVPATIAFAWVFFRFCEKPYMRKTAQRTARSEPDSTEAPQVFAQPLPAIPDEA